MFDLPLAIFPDTLDRVEFKLNISCLSEPETPLLLDMDAAAISLGIRSFVSWDAFVLIARTMLNKQEFADDCFDQAGITLEQNYVTDLLSKKCGAHVFVLSKEDAKMLRESSLSYREIQGIAKTQQLLNQLKVSNPSTHQDRMS